MRLTTIKNRWLELCLLSFTFVSNVAFADADDIFDPVNEKTGQLVDQVTTWAGAVSLLAIVIFGTLMMMNKVSKVWGVSIVGGGLVVLLGSSISKFIMT